MLRTQPWVSEDVGLIPGLAQWIKDLVLPSCSIVRRQDSDLALLWLWCRLAAEAPIQPLAWERPYAAGTALKRTTKKKVHTAWVLFLLQHGLRIRHCCSCGVGHSCGLDLIPGPGTCIHLGCSLKKKKYIKHIFLITLSLMISYTWEIVIQMIFL